MISNALPPATVKRPLAIAAAMLTCAVAAPATASCGAAVCALNTQWDAQGVATEPGLRLDLRFEYINQDQPRHGRDDVAVGEISAHHDEVRTVNRNWIATLDYVTRGAWSYSLTAPVVDRSHDHIHNHHGEKLPESWDFTALGDIRALARYHLGGSAGFQFGLKLPTGATDRRNADGDLAERSLQPGTGTTDGIVGLWYQRRLDLGAQPTAMFVQAQLQAPLNEHDDYRPGARLSVDAGLRHPLTAAVDALLQTNLVLRKSDRGAEAEPDDSGGSWLWLSPGINVRLGRQVQLYGFVQLPAYQRVNGVQLTARWASAVGASWKF